jgi:acyl carrier protein
VNTTPRGYATMVDWLTCRIAAHLHTTPDAIATDAPLSDHGLDSLFGLTLCADLERQLGLVVQPTIAWDYPTVDAIAGYLAGLSGKEQPAA